ncbi:hypothetical protein MMC31_003018 [Peltigera leucophlebia]|nr:hypothetical protein [Peltigera leucophlebia]
MAEAMAFEVAPKAMEAYQPEKRPDIPSEMLGQMASVRLPISVGKAYLSRSIVSMAVFTYKAHIGQSCLAYIYKKKPLTPSETLGSPEGVRLFAGWAPETKLFGRSENSGEAPEI